MKNSLTKILVHFLFAPLMECELTLLKRWFTGYSEKQILAINKIEKTSVKRKQIQRIITISLL